MIGETSIATAAARIYYKTSAAVDKVEKKYGALITVERTSRNIIIIVIIITTVIIISIVFMVLSFMYTCSVYIILYMPFFIRMHNIITTVKK